MAGVHAPSLQMPTVAPSTQRFASWAGSTTSFAAPPLHSSFLQTGGVPVGISLSSLTDVTPPALHVSFLQSFGEFCGGVWLLSGWLMTDPFWHAGLLHTVGGPAGSR